MDLFKLEDQFYPLMMRIYQVKHLTEDIMECSTCSLTHTDAVRRYHAFSALLGDVLNSAVSDAEQFEQMLQSGQSNKER